MRSLTNEKKIINNIIQGNFWKTHVLNNSSLKDKFVILLYVNQDEFECGNPLSAHAGTNKFGAVYLSIPCFPPYMASQLGYIMLNCLFNAEDRKEYGNRKIFSNLITELNELRNEGLLIKVFVEKGLFSNSST